MRKKKKNNKKVASKKFDLKTYIKQNKVMLGLAVVGITFLSVAVVSPQTFKFQKQKVEGSSFGSYKMPDKSSMNSSLPTRVLWHEPFFMDKKK